mmetsp:Transcript_33944/g.33090  ORF Transcript_33944/g.33090 Transcript_33944/m.33090 type:complete len:143 (+) Transcript_33944:65-493(+)
MNNANGMQYGKFIQQDYSHSSKPLGEINVKKQNYFMPVNKNEKMLRQAPQPINMNEGSQIGNNYGMGVNSNKFVPGPKQSKGRKLKQNFDLIQQVLKNQVIGQKDKKNSTSQGRNQNFTGQMFFQSKGGSYYLHESPSLNNA